MLYMNWLYNESMDKYMYGYVDRHVWVCRQTQSKWTDEFRVEIIDALMS